MDNFDPWQGIAIQACNATNMQSHQFDAQAIWKQAVLADQRANKASNLSIPGRGDLCQPQLHGNTTPAPENDWQLQADTTVGRCHLGPSTVTDLFQRHSILHRSHRQCASRVTMAGHVCGHGTKHRSRQFFTQVTAVAMFQFHFN